jgi:hypothetical protein
VKLKFNPIHALCVPRWLFVLKKQNKTFKNSEIEVQASENYWRVIAALAEKLTSSDRNLSNFVTRPISCGTLAPT